jgi:ABC-2 type transport system permease protein
MAVAKQDLLSGALDSFYRIPVDFVETGAIDVYFRDGLPVATVGGDRAFERLLVGRLLAEHVDQAMIARVRDPIETRNEWAIAEDGATSPRSVPAQLAALAVPMVFVMLFAMSLLMTSGLMVTAVSIEKENRVVEVLLSSATAEEILTGKLLGLGAAGMLQVSVWFGMVLGGGIATALTLDVPGWEVPWLGIGISAVFFAVAYLFVGSLMIGTGSLGNTQREGQLLGMPWTLLTLSPLFLIVPLVTEPHGTIGRVLSFIPFTAPVTIVLRAFAGPDELPLWEVALALAVLIGFTYLAIALAARLFRIGLLLSGARPSLRQIIRQAGFGARAT